MKAIVLQDLTLWQPAEHVQAINKNHIPCFRQLLQSICIGDRVPRGVSRSVNKRGQYDRDRPCCSAVLSHLLNGCNVQRERGDWIEIQQVSEQRRYPPSKGTEQRRRFTLKRRIRTWLGER